MKLYIRNSTNGGLYFLEPWEESPYDMYSYSSISDAREMAELLYDGKCDIAFVADNYLDDYINGDIDKYNIQYFDV